MSLDLIKEKAVKLLKVINYNDHDLRISNSSLLKLDELYKKDQNRIIRIVIDGGGCNGFQYKFLEDQVGNISTSSKDVLLIDPENQRGLLVFDLFSDFYIRGSDIEFENTILFSGFKIKNNPKAVSSCGCSKSFSTNEFYNGEI